MRASIQRRRTFNTYVAYDNLGGLEQLKVVAKYQAGLDKPETFTYSRIAMERETNRQRRQRPQPRPRKLGRQ